MESRMSNNDTINTYESVVELKSSATIWNFTLTLTLTKNG